MENGGGISRTDPEWTARPPRRPPDRNKALAAASTAVSKHDPKTVRDLVAVAQWNGCLAFLPKQKMLLP